MGIWVKIFISAIWLKLTFIHCFIDPTENHKKSKKIQFECFVNKSLKIHNAKNICRRAWRQMKENYQIYLPYQFHSRPHLLGGDAQLPHKKMKTMFLLNMSKSRRLTLTFFPTIRLCLQPDFLFVIIKGSKIKVQETKLIIFWP